MKKDLFRISIRKQVFSLILVMGTGIMFIASTKSCALSVSQVAKASAKKPRVEIKEQPGAPLRISIVRHDSVTPNTPEVEISLTNTSVHPIIAYTIRYEVISAHSFAGGSELTNKVSQENALQFGQSELTTIGQDNTYTDPIRRIILSVDFVEFVNGVTWGEDTYKSRDRLTGMRAGAREAAIYFTEVLKTNGLPALMKIVDTGEVPVVPQSSHSSEWIDGFRTGVSAIETRLKSLPRKEDIKEIEAALNRPIDASVRRVQ